MKNTSMYTGQTSQPHIRKNRMKRISGLSIEKVDNLFEKCTSFISNEDSKKSNNSKHKDIILLFDFAKL